MTFPFNPLDHPDAEVTRGYFCQLTGRSKISAYRHERSDPLWPKPVHRGGRVFYKALDCKRYLQSAQPVRQPILVGRAKVAPHRVMSAPRS